jgi:hypothetical protein
MQRLKHADAVPDANPRYLLMRSSGLIVLK